VIGGDLPLCTRSRKDDKIGPMAEGTLRSCFRPWWMLLTLLGAGCVLGLTHIPGEDVPRILQVHALDKVEHVVAYASIAGLFLLSLKRPARPALLLIGLGALAVIGALDETTQPLVNRTADLWDYASDLTGIAIAGVVFLIARLSGFHTAPQA
jgi:VanZ family protein